MGTSGDGLKLYQQICRTPDDERVKEIIDLSKNYGIITEYTSFLAEGDKDIPREELLKRTAYNVQHWNNDIERGQWAVMQSMNKNDMQYRAYNTNNFYIAQDGKRREINKVTRVNNQTFYNKNGQWVQNGAPTSNTRKVEVFSDEYFKLSRDNPDLSNAQALGKNVVVQMGKETIEFVEEKK